MIVSLLICSNKHKNVYIKNALRKPKESTSVLWGKKSRNEMRSAEHPHTFMYNQCSENWDMQNMGKFFSRSMDYSMVAMKPFGS